MTDALTLLGAALDEAADWQNTLAANGPDLRINAHKKTLHEAEELAEEPSLEEFADVVICLVATATHHGWTRDQIAAAIAAKTAVNRKRVWAQKPDGTWQHVASDAQLTGKPNLVGNEFTPGFEIVPIAGTVTLVMDKPGCKQCLNLDHPECEGGCL